MEFAYDGGGLGKGGEVTLFIDGAASGKGRVDATLAMVFSADDGCDVGVDNGAAVSPDYGPARQRVQRHGQRRATRDQRRRGVIRSPCNAGAGLGGRYGATIVVRVLSG